MKLLSTLFTALALVASVFTAPKAVAQDDDFDESQYTLAFGCEEAIMTTNTTPTYSNGVWTIYLTKPANASTKYVVLKIKGDENGFFSSYDYSMSDFEGSYYLNSSRLFTKIKNVTLSGNPTQGACTIAGTALFNQNGTLKVCKFKYVKSAEPRVSKPYSYTFTEGKLSYGQACYTFTLSQQSAKDKDSYDRVYVTINTGSREIFESATAYTIFVNDDRYGYTKCDIEGKTRTFETLSVKLTGNPCGDTNEAWSITGTGTLADDDADPDNDDTIEFSYTNAKKSESVFVNYDYCTYCPAKSVIVPENFKAYVASVDEEGLHVDAAYNAGEIIAAGTPVLLYGKGNATLNYTEEAGKDISGLSNGLKCAGTESTFNEDDYYFYGLMLGEADNAESVGFYWYVDDGKRFEVPAGKAYLPVLKSLVDSLDGARSGFSFSDATGIRTVAAEAQNAAAFNIRGQRIQEAKGLVIRGGKMMFVK